uniref:ORF 2 n=1 Tax=Torque teno virus TaxID=68887 RepID=A0A4D6IZ03_9VIRU|nr:ORF 2 [Torque teno virus]
MAEFTAPETADEATAKSARILGGCLGTSEGMWRVKGQFGRDPPEQPGKILKITCPSSLHIRANTGERQYYLIPYRMTAQHKEMKWRDIVFQSHGLFCTCSDPVNHLLAIETSFQSAYGRPRHSGYEDHIVGGGTGVAGPTGTAGVPEEVAEHGEDDDGEDDADFAAAAAATESNER